MPVFCHRRLDDEMCVFRSKRHDEITIDTTRKAPLFVIHSVCLCEIMHEQVCDW